MKRLLWLAAVLALALGVEAGQSGREILDATGVKGGLVVHVGCGDGKLTAGLRASESYIVQGLDAEVGGARKNIEALKAYGPVSVIEWKGGQLPYIDGLVNLVVAEDAGRVSMAEVMRVLVPNGVAYVGGQKTVKPRPAAMDDWTHYFYDARGNAVSKDAVVAPPERLQWVGSPRWSRHHDRMSSLSAQVSGGGRLFYIMDEGSRISILLPAKWVLTARDAFNGTVLWTKQIPTWQTQMWPLKSGPTELVRRLVTDGGRVFVTLAIDAPVSCLDAATGESIRVFEETRGAEEILHLNGVLYVLVNPKAWALKNFAPKFNTGDQKRVETEFNWDQEPRQLMAVDVATGRVLWKREDKIAPLTMTADDKRVVYFDGDKLVCLDPKTGDPRWTSGTEARRKLFEYNYAPRIILYKDLVLYAGGDGAEKGLSAETGEELWAAPHAKSGYRSPEDLIVAGGLVWNAPTTSGGMSGIFSGRDPLTGAVVKEFPPDVNCYWFHHRCYIAKATEKYILTSRTGVEFVDFEKSHWDLNHWVRGACLYGVLPANGLLYAGPHNCACYPEAKLDGMNALAPAGATSKPHVLRDEQRLERGPAHGQPLAERESDAKDWPTYRHDALRSGYTDQPLLENLDQKWELKLGGRLSAVTIAAGMVFVSQVDQHTLHAIDATTGKPVWHFIAGSRVDSPPTYWKGRVVFGGMDGQVYCLRASDGALIWRFLAAPEDRRHLAFEQVESVWPVHGSVLVENGVVSCVAGRSVFLDGGLRFVRLDAATGKKLVETVYDSKDPETGGDLQDRHKTLQMPVGLNDILSGDGKFIYLRSQKIQADGQRVEIGPVSGDAVKQGAAQQGEGAHIFAPMGFLDDTWFHRSYWVYGKNFSGGHSGYFQAGKYTPSARILVFDDENVYGFGREPKYYKWTTTMEYQLFSANKEAPDVKAGTADEGGGKKKAAARGAAEPEFPAVEFADSGQLDPSGKELTVEIWIKPDAPDGVIVQCGGGVNGYALALQDGRPAFAIRSDREGAAAEAARPLDPGWHHLAGVLSADKTMRLFVDGDLAAESKAPGLIAKKPNLGLRLGSPANSPISEFGRNEPFAGQLDLFAVFPKALGRAEIIEHATEANAVQRGNGAAIACSFDNADARDESGYSIQGVMSGVGNGKGKSGLALVFKPGDAAPVPAAPKAVAAATDKDIKQNGTFVRHHWDQYVPIITRAMAMAGDTVLIAGPHDTLNEEYAFERMAAKDPAIDRELAEQDAELEGRRGGQLMAVTAAGGSTSHSAELKSPPVWDGMAVAQGHLFTATMDGNVICYGIPKK